MQSPIPPPSSTAEIARRIYDDFTPLDLMDTFISLQKPTLYFKGEMDGHLSEEDATALESLGHVRLIRLKESGHSPSKSDFGIFISEIKNFVDGLN